MGPVLGLVVMGAGLAAACLEHQQRFDGRQPSGSLHELLAVPDVLQVTGHHLGIRVLKNRILRTRRHTRRFCTSQANDGPVHTQVFKLHNM